MRTGFGLIFASLLLVTTIIGCGDKDRGPRGKSCRASEQPYNNYKPYADFDEKTQQFSKINISNADEFPAGVYTLNSAEVFYHNKSEKGGLKDLKVHVSQTYNANKDEYTNNSVCVGNFTLGSKFSGGQDIIAFMDVADPNNIKIKTSFVGFDRQDRLELTEVGMSDEITQTPEEFFAAAYPNYDYTFTHVVNKNSKESTYEWRANVQDGAVNYELRAVYGHMTHEAWAEKQAKKAAEKK